ncbi:hypothetical protein ASG31_14735 [Chryseobacterium sp. Leaf404]|uniref:class I SAM-dependent methyltransferase n=1 Tax=unclassified Chryseobacterium TaxID=2593645 RepID=UPI0006F31B00|nr:MULTISPECIES: class I SAM-dependent methyltransferase [unclassified Chryseobacterium]KQT15514.1 hypothetical protein ASG31_14735 [Chryseobacterium sp. Leaf404]
MGIINAVKHHIKKLEIANQFVTNKHYGISKEKFLQEIKKTPLRTDIINYLIEYLNRETTYLEIGVRNPADNFVKIKSAHKYSVDPGYENSDNNVDFKLTSDDFFSQLESGEILDKNIKFDAIFIDGSHLAEQVEKDIFNALNYLKDDGFIIMHDCNTPTEFHASECYDYHLSPARTMWNGTTWKAFAKNRKRNDIFACVIDTDWGIGVISKKINLGNPSTVDNEFFEYRTFEKYRQETLNLISFVDFKKLLP